MKKQNRTKLPETILGMKVPSLELCFVVLSVTIIIIYGLAVVGSSMMALYDPRMKAIFELLSW